MFINVLPHIQTCPIETGNILRTAMIVFKNSHDLDFIFKTTYTTQCTPKKTKIYDFLFSEV